METLELSDPVGFDSRVEVVVVGGAVAPLADILTSMPGIRWIHASSAGVERFLVPEVVERDDIVLTNSSGAHDEPMAEFVIGALFAAAKRIPDHIANQAVRHWPGGKEHGLQRMLRGATIVVVGPGRVGTEVVRLAGLLGMNVIVVRRTAEPFPGAAETVGPERLAQVAARADYLVATAALTGETRGLISAEVLTALPRHAWVVNVGRGPLIDEDALLTALRTGAIAGAVLDTLWDEPLPPDSQWWTAPNAIITGHTSSGSAHNLERTVAAFTENLERYRAGQPLLNVVDKRAGY